MMLRCVNRRLFCYNRLRIPAHASDILDRKVCVFIINSWIAPYEQVRKICITVKVTMVDPDCLRQSAGSLYL